MAPGLNHYCNASSWSYAAVSGGGISNFSSPVEDCLSMQLLIIVTGPATINHVSAITLSYIFTNILPCYVVVVAVVCFSNFHKKTY